MSASKDPVGDLLREFYDTFGMPDEGPPADLNVTTAFGWLHSDRTTESVNAP